MRSFLVNEGVVGGFIVSHKPMISGSAYELAASAPQTFTPSVVLFGNIVI